MRCFIALLPDATTRNALAAIQPRRRPGIVPAAMRSLHLTLQFCADLPDATLKQAMRALPMLARALTPLQPYGWADWHPGPRHAVLVAEYAVHADLATLAEAARQLTGETTPTSVPWSPHVTLARRYDGLHFLLPAQDPPPFHARALALIGSQHVQGRFVHDTLVQVRLPTALAPD